MAKIATIKIHPAIGIARIGNSDTEFFIGPERPGDHTPPKGGYRDAQGRIKRQAARFRLFAYDKKGKLIREITAKEADITWSVELANKKAAWLKFQGRKSITRKILRNESVLDRSTLMITPGPRSLTGKNKVAKFDTGKFLGTAVSLGEIRTDREGRLLVLGGLGRSGSPTHVPINEDEFANNDGWHDDVSDGPVTATIKFKDSVDTVKSVGAWVICAIPKFTPMMENPTTLYDVLLQVAVDKLGLKRPAKPSFTKDIYPLFKRAMTLRWVSEMVAHPPAEEEEGGEEPMAGGAAPMHMGEDAPEGPAHQTLAGVIPPHGSAAARAKIFEKMRDPAIRGDRSSGESDMPMAHSDYYPVETNQPLTRLQYDALRKWKDGKFINDWVGHPAPSREITPEGLDRAGLETCVGGPFYPGIDAGWMMRDTFKYSEPFRLDSRRLKAGDVTKQMAVPWQADFSDCKQEGELGWWPAQRPDEVIPDGHVRQVPWTRGLAESMAAMVKNWHRLGFIIKKGSRYVETERKG